MSIYPINKQISDYEKISDDFPFYVNKFPLSSPYPPHRHDFLELSFIIEGEGYQIIDNRTYPMNPGTFMLLLPYQIQEMITVSQNQIRLYNCVIDLSFLSLPTAQGNGLEKLITSKEELPPSIQLSGTDMETVARLFEEMTEEYNHEREWRIQRLQIKLWDLLILFDRLRKKEGTCQSPKDDSGVPPIWSIIRYVHLHYREPLSLSELADRFSMSSSYLSEQFKKQLGLNFVHFLHEVRIRHACSLIISTDMTVLDIALEVGYGSFRTFLRSFRDLKHLTPTEYRNRFRRGR